MTASPPAPFREMGTDRKRFMRGEVDKYTRGGAGSSYVLSDLLAAFLVDQLESSRALQENRRRLWRRYVESLRGWVEAKGGRLPVVPDHCYSAYHLYAVLLTALAERTRRACRTSSGA